MTTPISEPGRFIPGTLLAGRYRIVGLVGRGGMGEVYRADDLKLGQPVALEVPARRRRARPGAARAVPRRGADRAADLPPERLPRLRRRRGRRPALPLDGVRGRRGPGEPPAARIGRLPHEQGDRRSRAQLCAGLAAAHEKGVLHRDLKPANIMIDGRGARADHRLRARARLAEQLVARSVRSGTPAYMAPEQLAGREVTVHSDLYALGLVLYELFTGRRPFEADTREVLAYQRQETPPDTPSTRGGRRRSRGRARRPALSRSRIPRARPASALQIAAALPGRRSARRRARGGRDALARAGRRGGAIGRAQPGRGDRMSRGVPGGRRRDRLPRADATRLDHGAAEQAAGRAGRARARDPPECGTQRAPDRLRIRLLARSRLHGVGRESRLLRRPVEPAPRRLVRPRSSSGTGRARDRSSRSTAWGAFWRTGRIHRCCTRECSGSC